MWKSSMRNQLSKEQSDNVSWSKILHWHIKQKCMSFSVKTVYHHTAVQPKEYKCNTIKCQDVLDMVNKHSLQKHKNQRQKFSLATGLGPQHVQLATNSNELSLIKSISSTLVHSSCQTLYLLHKNEFLSRSSISQMLPIQAIFMSLSKPEKPAFLASHYFNLSQN